MAQLQVRRLAYALGAEVSGIDVSKPLDDATVSAIRRAWLEHLFLCFPNQHLEREQLAAFAERFGELEIGRSDDYSSDQTPGIAQVTNKPINGDDRNKHALPGQWQRAKPRNGAAWHTDESFTTQPTSAAILYCKQIPLGGNTMFANMYMAHDALSPRMRELVAQLSAIHYGPPLRSRTYLPAVHRVVRIHPETNRKALYLGVRARQFVGMTEGESKPLIDFLNAHAVSYEFTYRHTYAAHDVVVWDNRCLMHIALADYDLDRDLRDMWRTAVAGEQSGYYYTSAADREDPMAAVPR